MYDEKEIIPRNVINKNDTLPLDFIIHFELELRQIPYFLVGGVITVFAIINPVLQIQYKAAISVIAIGANSCLSMFKVEGQPLEIVLLNYLKFNNDKSKMKHL